MVERGGGLEREISEASSASGSLRPAKRASYCQLLRNLHSANRHSAHHGVLREMACSQQLSFESLLEHLLNLIRSGRSSSVSTDEKGNVECCRARVGRAALPVVYPGRTSRIAGPRSIASLERVRIGGVDQYILIRGNDTSLPILLFLHGGPGMPAMYLAHAFQRPLEKDFVVVQWDRRGAGKSYREDLSGTLTSEQLVADTVELTNLLRARFHQDKIYLVAHSWGTYLGMIVIARYPELYHAYVGFGQLARSSPIPAIQDEYIRESARRAGDGSATKELEEKGGSVRETLLFKFGGELYHAKSFLRLLLTGLAAPEYSLGDARNIPKAVSLYSQPFVSNSVSGELMDVITRVKVPVYFFTGRHDYTDPFTRRCHIVLIFSGNRRADAITLEVSVVKSRVC